MEYDPTWPDEHRLTAIWRCADIMLRLGAVACACPQHRDLHAYIGVVWELTSAPADALNHHARVEALERLLTAGRRPGDAPGEGGTTRDDPPRKEGTMALLGPDDGSQLDDGGLCHLPQKLCRQG